MKKSVSKGFTLIELLVVIAIIGILASIVLVNLNSARSKGQDAKVKAELANARAQAEIYYDTNSTYQVTDGSNSVCVATAANGGLAAIVSSSGGTCNDNATAWAMAADLPSQTGTIGYCVDSTGAARQIADATSFAAVVCPAS